MCREGSCVLSFITSIISLVNYMSVIQASVIADMGGIWNKFLSKKKKKKKKKKIYIYIYLYLYLGTPKRKIFCTHTFHFVSPCILHFENTFD